MAAGNSHGTLAWVSAVGPGEATPSTGWPSLSSRAWRPGVRGAGRLPKKARTEISPCVAINSKFFSTPRREQVCRSQSEGALGVFLPRYHRRKPRGVKAAYRFHLLLEGCQSETHGLQFQIWDSCRSAPGDTLKFIQTV